MSERESGCKQEARSFGTVAQLTNSSVSSDRRQPSDSPWSLQILLTWLVARDTGRKTSRNASIPTLCEKTILSYCTLLGLYIDPARSMGLSKTAPRQHSVYMCVRVRAHVHTCTHTYTRTHTCTHTYTRTHTCTHTYTLARAQRHTYIQTVQCDCM